ncbi:hypothetical protein Tco_0964476 [Tanacetum coccineum]
MSYAEDAGVYRSYVGNTLSNLNKKNQILTDQFTSFSTLFDDMIASLLKKLLVVQQLKGLQKSLIEQHVSDKENMSITIEGLQGELEKSKEGELEKMWSMYNQIKEENDAFPKRVLKLENELEASSNTCNEMSLKLEDYRAKEDKWIESTRELSTQSISAASAKENMSATIEELHGELEKTTVLRLENELEAPGNTCNKLSSKLEDYRAKEDGWKKSKQELSGQSISPVKYHEGDAGNALLSASQIKSLFDKIDGITIPFPDLVVRDIQPQDSDPVKKLFYVVDSVNELLDQLTLLTHAKEDLRSTLSQQTLEVDHLKGEFKEGLQNFFLERFVTCIEESGGIKKPANCWCMSVAKMRVKIINALLRTKIGYRISLGIVKIPIQRPEASASPLRSIPADAYSLSELQAEAISPLMNVLQSRVSLAEEFKLVETQKVAKDLSSIVKLLEDFIQSRIDGPDTIQERGVFESPLTAESEISKVDE